jgi:hypothetical protein
MLNQQTRQLCHVPKALDPSFDLSGGYTACCEGRVPCFVGHQHSSRVPAGSFKCGPTHNSLRPWSCKQVTSREALSVLDVAVSSAAQLVNTLALAGSRQWSLWLTGPQERCCNKRCSQPGVDGGTQSCGLVVHKQGDLGSALLPCIQRRLIHPSYIVPISSLLWDYQPI